MSLEERKIEQYVRISKRVIENQIGDDEPDAMACRVELKAKSSALKLILEPHSLYKLRLKTLIIEKTITRSMTYIFAINLGK